MGRAIPVNRVQACPAYGDSAAGSAHHRAAFGGGIHRHAVAMHRPIIAGRRLQMVPAFMAH